MILLQWMMWCIFYVGFVRDPASILVGFVGDLPSVILCVLSGRASFGYSTLVSEEKASEK